MAELRLASDDEKLARDRFTHEAWGQRLAVDEFVVREARLRAHPWARDGMRTWLLVEDGRILSSCETFAMQSIFRGARGASWGIASVYTEPALRRAGHAAHMMRLLVEKMGEVDPRAQASILFSDVGDYYARFGWRAVPAFDRVLAPLRSDPAVEWLEEPLDLAPPDEEFVVWPSTAQLDWHRERERAYADLLQRAPLSHAGARAGRGAIVWAANFKKEELVVLLAVGDDEELRALAAAAQDQAARARLSRVVAWETPGWPASLGERRAREGSLPMILPLISGLSSAAWTHVPRAIWV